jgi:hypothetical protein
LIHSWGGSSRWLDPRVSDSIERDESELREDYEDYRERHARRLVALLPREAIRPLYRAALSDPTLDTVPDDPLAKLTEYCARLLPLPPFDVWVEDVRANPDAYLLDLREAANAPTAASPATLETRRLSRSDGSWLARLRGFRDRDAWRGFIAFEDESSGLVHHTALIFREGDPRDLRRRFLSFEAGTLEAFLRSSLR